MGNAERVAREHLQIVAAGDYGAVAANVTSDYFNHRSADEPVEARQRGPEGLKATMRWLHRAFAEMRFEFHDVAVNGNLVTMPCAMTSAWRSNWDGYRPALGTSRA